MKNNKTTYCTSVLVNGLNVVGVGVRIDRCFGLSRIANNFDDFVLLFLGKAIHFIQTNIQQCSVCGGGGFMMMLRVSLIFELTHFA
jgi:hypothetical protein